MNDYDLREIFEQMELELIASMKRNLARHQKWEKDEGMNWSMWQVEQLKTLEKFKQENKEIFTKRFTSVNNEIAKFIEDNYKTAGFDQEKAILQELAKGNIVNQKYEKGLEGGFFSLNEDKMHALIKATTNNMKTAETAMLRMVNDQYRKTIFRAQVMANSGAFTLQQSIDAATKDFLKAGINCIQYKDGRRVNIASYAEMYIRTSTKRAKLVSEGDVRKAYGIHTVRISRYGQCSNTCLPWQGRVYVDDKFSGGTKEEAKEKNLPLLSEAIDGGLFHPNCKHISTTYFYELKKSLGKLQEDGVENPPEEQEHRKNQLHIQQQKRLETGSLDPRNIEQAKEIKKMWEEKDRQLTIEENNRELDYIPEVFQFSNFKESNLVDIYADIDKKFQKDGFEHMAITDSKTGILLKPIISSNSKKSVYPNKELFYFIVDSKPKSLTLIHNHPGSNPFSITDIITTNEYISIKESIVINGQGEVYFLYIPQGKEIDLSTDELRNNFKDVIIKQRKKYAIRFPYMTKKDINHLSYAKVFEKLGWYYGRKKYG